MAKTIIIYSGADFGGTYEERSETVGETIVKNGLKYEVTDQDACLNLEEGKTICGFTAIYKGAA